MDCARAAHPNKPVAGPGKALPTSAASLPEAVADAFPGDPACVLAPRAGGALLLTPQRGRGAFSNASGRFETETRLREVDGWDLPEDLPPLRTQVTQESAKTIITRNDSPDISFEQ